MNNIIKFSGILIIILSIFFISQIISNNWSIIKHGPTYFNAYFFLLAIFFLEIFWLYQSLIFRFIYSNFENKPKYSSICRIMFLNNLLAYIPGKIIGWIGVSKHSSKINLSASSILWTLLLFQVYSFISAGLVSLALINFINLEISSLFIIIVTIIFGFIFLIFSNKIKLILLKILNLIKKVPNTSNQNISFNKNIINILLYTISWLIMGFTLWCIISSLTKEVISLPEVVIIFIISYIFAQLTIVVPAGLGVLEAGLILLLSRIISIEIAIYSVAAFRILIISTNLISLIIVELFFSLVNKRVFSE